MSTFFLRPFSHLYGKLLDCRNYLYESGVKKVFTPNQQTICVGNLTVGGTGKTPMIEYLVRMLSNGEAILAEAGHSTLDVATLSRGYGRKTNGFRIAQPGDTAHTLGDEPLQLYQKYGRQVVVAVAERRAEGLQFLSEQRPTVKIVLLDDAYQHRAVQPHLTILLTDYARPFYQDRPFPEGRLRENRLGARRADVIVVTKCPNNLSRSERQQIIDDITPYKDTATPIFFTGLSYDAPKSFRSQNVTLRDKSPVVLVSGLANADPLEDYVQATFTMTKHYRFNDHFDYSRTTLNQMLQELPAEAALLTTEKDWVKLEPLLTPEERATVPLYYLPITVCFLEQEAEFRRIVQAVAFPKNR